METTGRLNYFTKSVEGQVQSGDGKVVGWEVNQAFSSEDINFKVAKKYMYHWNDQEYSWIYGSGIS